jgi:hypothetical protein
VSRRLFFFSLCLTTLPPTHSHRFRFLRDMLRRSGGQGQHQVRRIDLDRPGARERYRRPHFGSRLLGADQEHRQQIGDVVCL